MINTIGMLIRKERKAQKITQEKLSEGICDPSWLSKIESGTRMPEPNIAESLLKRLGLEPHQYIYYFAEEELDIINLKHHIRRCYSSGYEEEAKEHFSKLKKIFQDKELPKLDRQFMILYDVFLELKDQSWQFQLDKLTEALQITRPNFDSSKLMDYLISDDEMILINNIAILKYKIEEKIKAKETLIRLKDYMECHKLDYETKRRVYPVILYNLTNWQGLAGEYASCLENCENGIEFCKKYNVLSLFPYFLFNQGCALASLGSKEKAQKSLKFSFVIFESLSLEDEADSGRKYVEDKYQIIL